MYAQDFQRAGVVAVGGGEIGSVEGVARNEIRQRLEKRDAESAPWGNQLYRFANEIKTGDLVITPDGSTRQLLLGDVTGDYEFLTEGVGGEQFRHAHQVHWQGRQSRDVLDRRVLYSLGSILTIFKPKGRDQLLAMFRGESIEPHQDAEAGEETEAENLLADLQARSAELIDAAVAGLDAYETQSLVAGLLRAMGYHTTESPPGADQGVDIIASRDPLGLGQRVKVQVKARPNTRSGAPDVVQLAGNVSAGERGMFVSTGGFTREAESHPAAQAISRVDGQRLRELLLSYYDSLDSDTQALLPLRRLYFPAD